MKLSLVQTIIALITIGIIQGIICDVHELVTEKSLSKEELLSTTKYYQLGSPTQSSIKPYDATKNGYKPFPGDVNYDDDSEDDSVIVVNNELFDVDPDFGVNGYIYDKPNPPFEIESSEHIDTNKGYVYERPLIPFPDPVDRPIKSNTPDFEFPPATARIIIK